MIDVNEPLSYDGGFPKVDNALYRLYPLLDDYTLETTAVYGYLKSWENNRQDHSMYGKAWLTFNEMAALTGMSYFKLRKNIDILKKYGLVIESSSDKVANKSIFETCEPLTEAEFRAQYTEAIQAVRERIEAVESVLERDRERRRSKRIMDKY